MIETTMKKVAKKVVMIASVIKIILLAERSFQSCHFIGQLSTEIYRKYTHLNHSIATNLILEIGENMLNLTSTNTHVI